MNKKPIIGIAGNVITFQGDHFENFWRCSVSEDYVKSVLKAGGVPYIMPIVDDEEVIEIQLDHVDGMIITGGDNDIQPSLYGQEEKEKTESPHPERDFFDFRLERLAKKMKKPSLFICRGHQVAAVSNGGSLYQDVSYAPGITLKHHHHPRPDYPAHKVDIDPKSLLFDVLGKETFMVNSFHHQLVKDVPEGFKVCAVAPDGCIEAIEPEKQESFYLSIQWHPEMMAARGDEEMIKIFERLIQESTH